MRHKTPSILEKQKIIKLPYPNLTFWGEANLYNAFLHYFWVGEGGGGRLSSWKRKMIGKNTIKYNNNVPQNKKLNFENLFYLSSKP